MRQALGVQRREQALVLLPVALGYLLQAIRETEG